MWWFRLAVRSDSFVTPWTVACQAPLSVEFSRQETGVGFPFLLPGIFLIQGSNLSLLPCRDSLPIEPPGKHYTETEGETS